MTVTTYRIISRTLYDDESLHWKSTYPCARISPSGNEVIISCQVDYDGPELTRTQVLEHIATSSEWVEEESE